MKKLLLIIALVIAGYAGFNEFNGSLSSSETGAGIDVTSGNSGDATLARAVENQTSNLQVEGKGTVTRILADDTDGSQHQRFIIRLDSGQTLLVAHNIDVAPRIESLRAGDTVMFNGEYEWNAKGGVIHWTHHDPDGSHVAGWIKHAGQTYQ